MIEDLRFKNEYLRARGGDISSGKDTTFTGDDRIPHLNIITHSRWLALLLPYVFVSVYVWQLIFSCGMAGTFKKHY